jgi:hypothetical protein
VTLSWPRCVFFVGNAFLRVESEFRSAEMTNRNVFLKNVFVGRPKLHLILTKMSVLNTELRIWKNGNCISENRFAELIRVFVVSACAVRPATCVWVVVAHAACEWAPPCHFRNSISPQRKLAVGVQGTAPRPPRNQARTVLRATTSQRRGTATPRAYAL